jgi:hypothetical protein
VDGGRRRLPSETGSGYVGGRVPLPGDPSLNSVFAHHAIRRSAALVLASATMVAGAAWLAGTTGGNALPLLLVAAAFGALLVIAVPLLLWALADEARRRWRRRTSPDLAVLGLPTRTENILRRAGVETLADLAGWDDVSLMALPRMDEPDLRAIQRQWSLHRYRDWQAKGFPDR